MISALAALLLLCAGCATRVPIEVRNAGDRVVDPQFSAILKQTFEDSAPFELTDRSDSLVAMIRLAHCTDVGQRVQIQFVVDIARHGSVIGTTAGSCEKDSPEQCAAAVVRDTRYFLDGGR